jgi:hypothetical protein
MAINISDNDPRIHYTATAGQTLFIIPFTTFDDNDLLVYVNGVLKTITSDYTIANSEVTLLSAASLGDKIALTRNVPIERTTDLTSSYSATAIDDQLDRIVSQIADLDDKAGRSIQIADSELATSLDLPLVDDRKGKTIQFNSVTGALEAGPTSNDIATIASNIAEILDTNNQAAAAAASATAAASSATAAQTAETAAELAETNAETAETGAAASAATATTKAGEASTSAAAAAASEAGADADRVAAQTAATNAAASETNAATSETNAATSATNAATSETNAATSATASSTSASASATSETNAGTSETNAAASETAAGTSETNASTSEANAATSETNAATSASTATTKATEASTSATNAATSAASAQASKDAALEALDSFDDRYLGQKAADPSVDNDGNALISGALYFNTTDDIMKVYDGSLWVAAYASLSGAMFGANNLSDVADAAGSRQNLGLGTAATTASTAYATAAQGTLADSAIQSGDLATVATTGSYSDLTGLPTLGTAAATASTDYATAAQGTLADSAVQPNDNPTFAGLTTTANVSFGDNDKAIFGAGSDLQIYHDGSNSYVTDTGTGNLSVLANVFRVYNAAGDELSANFVQNGAVTLYHDNDQKLATTSTGVNVTGTITVTGTVDGRDVATDGTKLDGIETGATADQTAAQLLTAIKTVDGAGSGLDADLLDGLSEATFMRRSANSQLDMNNNDIVGVDQIIHEGDTNTYIQFHAADQWRVVTGGAERLEVHNSRITSTEPVYAPSFHGNGSALTGVVSTTAGAVGTYGFFFSYVAVLNPGTSVGGGSLKYGSVSGTNDQNNSGHSVTNAGNTAPSGTWRCMGQKLSGYYTYPVTLFVRIS